MHAPLKVLRYVGRLAFAGFSYAHEGCHAEALRLCLARLWVLAGQRFILVYVEALFCEHGCPSLDWALVMDVWRLIVTDASDSAPGWSKPRQRSGPREAGWCMAVASSVDIADGVFTSQVRQP